MILMFKVNYSDHTHYREMLWSEGVSRAVCEQRTHVFHNTAMLTCIQNYQFFGIDFGAQASVSNLKLRTGT